MNLKQAEQACRESFIGVPVGSWVWCCHHENLYEQLTEPAENRIQFILNHKAESELVTRLNNFRPVENVDGLLSMQKAYAKAIASAQKAYDKAIAPAQKAYDKAVASAQKAYTKAIASAREAYAKAIAPAREAYAKAIASAREAYAKAIASAQKAYDKAIAPAREALIALNKQEVPLSTWNGTNIFSA